MPNMILNNNLEVLSQHARYRAQQNGTKLTKWFGVNSLWVSLETALSKICRENKVEGQYFIRIP